MTQTAEQFSSQELAVSYQHQLPGEGLSEIYWILPEEMKDTRIYLFPFPSSPFRLKRMQH
jgi:hypothetical protein